MNSDESFRHSMDEDWWIFGYGSLIWKVDFAYERRVIGYVRGFQRRFWQGSHDHRGTEERPGRVVTLIKEQEWRDRFADADETVSLSGSKEAPSECWGVAYKVAAKDVEEVKRHLDFREKNGYDTFVVDVMRPESSTPIVHGATVYVATHDNHAFLGPRPIDEVARQIATSVGPSGKNIDYFLSMCWAMRVIAPGHVDEHLDALEHAIQKMTDIASIQPGDMTELKKLYESGSTGMLQNS